MNFPARHRNGFAFATILLFSTAGVAFGECDDLVADLVEQAKEMAIASKNVEALKLEIETIVDTTLREDKEFTRDAWIEEYKFAMNKIVGIGLKLEAQSCAEPSS